MALVYKIRRKSDGLFSSGGSYPHFTKVGKIWRQKGHLTNHLNYLLGDRSWKGSTPYDDCEIVSYELVEQQVGDGQTIINYLAEITMRKKEREAAAKRRADEFQKEQRRQQYERLRREFENES